MAITVSLLTAACAGSSDPPDGTTRPGSGLGEPVIDLGDDETGLTAPLSAFDECDSLLDHLRSEYAERVGPWGFGNERWHEFGSLESAAEPAPDADGSDSGSAEPVGTGLIEGVDYSGTNVQETGVDEADLVKTDGRRIFAVSNGQLSVIDTADRQIKGVTRLTSGQKTELLLNGDDLLVILNGYLPPGEIAAGAADGLEITDRTAWHEEPVTVVQRVRVDDYSPRVVETLWIDGAYVSARSVDGVARVVTRHDPARAFPFVSPQGGSRSEEAAEEANRAAVTASTLEDWLPSYAVASGASTSGPVEGGLLPACQNVYVPIEFAGFGVTTVLSLSVGGPLAGDGAVSVMAPGDTVYASPRSLYVDTSTWIAPELLEDASTRQRMAEDWRTALHRFDLTDPARAPYTASGSVPGRIRNQFSLSEHDGHLRVVTTTGNLWWGQADAESSSQVRVLRQTGDRLMEVGAVGDIGRGEQVQSVRFTGAVGYVVTFRQVDPFYTLDLSDPENPAIVGELKIPGFSSYLHPIGDDRVLGVGVDADESTGAVTGSKVSLFDVSDLANPREVAVWIGPRRLQRRGLDHRAFLWWGPAQLVVFDISSWSDQTAEAVALRVEGDSLTEIGRIDHTDPSENIGSTECRRLDRNPPGEVKPSDLWYPLAYPDAVACEPGEGPMFGFDCIPTTWLEEADWPTIDNRIDIYGDTLGCEIDESQAMVGFDCWRPYWVQADARSSGLITGYETLFACQIDGQDIIVRNLVIGDELWTLSYHDGDTYRSADGKLATSDLTTLDRTALIDLF